VAPDGQPIRVCFDRWSNANPEKQHRLQPFGGYLSKFQSFDGFRLHWHPAVEWTGGGLVSTSRDLARWGSALFSGEVLCDHLAEMAVLPNPPNADF
jgi:CubicO group peptidase (beta-lactamase class C family)